MEETTPNRDPDLAARPARMSLAARLLNVFAVPGEVFNDVRTAPLSISNWLVPVLLAALVGVGSALLILSQPKIEKQVEERLGSLLEETAKSRNWTAEQRQQVHKLVGPALIKTIGASEAAVGTIGTVIWWGFALWFLAQRLLRVKVDFAKALEISGLAMMIDVLGGIVAMLLVVNLGRIGETAGLALVVKDFDVTRKSHLFAAAVNVFSFWVLGVRSIGLAKLAGVPYLRAAWLVVTFWLLQQLFFVLTGLAQLPM